MLANACLVVTSTPQESTQQYGLYESYQPGRAVVIPPGTDTSRFAPPGKASVEPRVEHMIDRFHDDSRKPLVLAICRPEVRKHLGRLVDAFGASPRLRQRANLAVVAGQRDDIRALDEDQAQVLTDLLLAVDRHDLWGQVALPKQHLPEDVPQLYRLAARRRGAFVNPALTEPFGLTLIEAMASGLPVFATRHGGPLEIIQHGASGFHIDPNDGAVAATAMADFLEQAATDPERWQAVSRGALARVEAR